VPGVCAPASAQHVLEPHRSMRAADAAVYWRDAWRQVCDKFGSMSLISITAAEVVQPMAIWLCGCDQIGCGEM
jgi:hypothetical protein